MNAFAIAAGMMAVILLVAGAQRLRLAVIVAAIHRSGGRRRCECAGTRRMPSNRSSWPIGRDAHDEIGRCTANVAMKAGTVTHHPTWTIGDIFPTSIRPPQAQLKCRNPPR
jgi:hypothetical protein